MSRLVKFFTFVKKPAKILMSSTKLMSAIGFFNEFPLVKELNNTSRDQSSGWF